MHLLTVPRIGSGKSIGDPLRADVPAWLHERRRGWGMASEMRFGVNRDALVYVNCSPAELDELLLDDRIRHCGDTATAEQFRRMDEGLAAQAADWSRWLAARDDVLRAKDVDALKRARDAFDAVATDVRAFHRGVTDEFLGAYRPLAAALEVEEAKNIYALATLHQDDFDRSDRSLNGDTMSDGVGAWANDIGTFSIVSNQAKATAGGPGGDATTYDSVMSAVDVQRATAASQSASGGTLARYTTTLSSGYLAYRSAGNKTQSYRISLGISSYVQLGSDGSTVSNGDTVGCDATGTSISAYLNGASDVGPNTDATYATGRCGMYGALNALLDSFVAEVAGSSSSIKTIDGLAVASVKTVNGLAIASVKTFNGLA